MHVVLALGAKLDTVGDGTVLVALVDGTDGFFEGGVPAADIVFPLFGGELFLGFQPGTQGNFGGLHVGEGLPCRADHHGILPRHVNDGLRFLFFFGTVDDHVGTDGRKNNGQHDNRYNNNNR